MDGSSMNIEKDAGKTMEGRTSLVQLMDQIGSRIDRLQRDHHELSLRLDSMIPDADDNRHYDDHSEIKELRIERRRFWSNLRSQAVAGVVMAAGGGLVGWIVFSLLVKTGGA